MFPASVTGQSVMQLADEFEADDIIIDGGNSYYRDDIARASCQLGHLERNAVHDVRSVEQLASGGLRCATAPHLVQPLVLLHEAAPRDAVPERAGRQRLGVALDQPVRARQHQRAAARGPHLIEERKQLHREDRPRGLLETAVHVPTRRQ